MGGIITGIDGGAGISGGNDRAYGGRGGGGRGGSCGGGNDGASAY